MHLKIDHPTPTSPLAVVRSLLGVHQSELAESTGLSRNTISRAENGKSKKSSVLGALAGLGVSGERADVAAFVDAVQSRRKVIIKSIEMEIADAADGEPDDLDSEDDHA